MKTRILNYFQNEKNARQKTSDIESYVINEMDDLYEESGGYEFFCVVINELVKEGFIRPVAAWKKNTSLSPVLYNGYQYINKEIDLDQLFIRDLLTCFHNKMDMNYYLRNRNLFFSDRFYLEQLNAFLHKPSDCYAITTNERSFEIFGNEKFLMGKSGKEFLNRIRLTFEDLQCYPTYEQFIHYEIKKDPKSFIIIENKDTYDSVKRLMIEGIDTWDGVSLDMVIYGEGNKILRSFSFLDELGIFNYKGYYFGDLDPQGIYICTSVMEMSEGKVQPFTGFYSFLLNNYERSERDVIRPMKHSTLEKILSIFLPYFCEKEQAFIRHIITKNGNKQGYLPQEGLNKRILSKMSSKED